MIAEKLNVLLLRNSFYYILWQLCNFTLFRCLHRFQSFTCETSKRTRTHRKSLCWVFKPVPLPRFDNDTQQCKSLTKTSPDRLHTAKSTFCTAEVIIHYFCALKRSCTYMFLLSRSLVQLNFSPYKNMDMKIYQLSGRSKNFLKAPI